VQLLAAVLLLFRPSVPFGCDCSLTVVEKSSPSLDFSTSQPGAAVPGRQAEAPGEIYERCAASSNEANFGATSV